MKSHSIAVLVRGMQVWIAALILVAGTTQVTGADAPPPTSWESSAAMGLTLTSGNSDTMLFNANLLTTKKWTKDRLTFGADATYGENNSVKNNEAFRGYGQYNLGLSDRSYGFGRIEGLHDGIADIDYRGTLSAGAGYYLLKDKKFELSAEAGPAYVMEKRGGVKRDYASLRLGENFKWKISEKARLWESIEFVPQVEDFQNYLINFEIGLETSITDKLGLRVTLIDSYINRPAPGRKSNDIKLVTGLSYKF